MPKPAKISCYYVASPEDETVEAALASVQIILSSFRDLTGQNVMIDPDVGLEHVGNAENRATYFTKLICEGLVDIGELVPLGFDFELID